MPDYNDVVGRFKTYVDFLNNNQNCVSIYMDPSLVRNAYVYLKGGDTDTKMVSVEDVLETIRDIAQYPGRIMIVDDILADLESRLMKRR